MPPKKKPLEDARKRLQEKLSNVEEQSEYICQFINELVNKASTPAKELLEQKDRKKFFQKYSSVSQELEKCLDCLLLISDSVTALGEEDTLGAGEDDASSASESSDHTDRGPAASTKVSSLKKTDSAQSPADKTKEQDSLSDKTAADAKPESEVKGTQQSVQVKKSELGKEDVSVEREHKLESREEDVQVTSKAKESAAETIKPDKLQSSVPASVSTSNSISAASEQECLTQEQTSPPKIVAKPQKDLQSTKNQTAKSIGENSNKQNHQSSSVSSVAQSSKEGLKLISSLKDVEQPKHSANQTQADEAPSSRVQKNSKRKGSASSTGALSDIIQDIRISPREAKMAGDNTPTKVQLAPYPFKNGQKLDVVVTEVLSPWEFWIQPVGAQLDLLMEEMCMHYAKLAAAGYKGGLATAPAMGDFCCAKFTQDDTWYRVLVTAVEESDKGPVVSVLSVDDGTREKVGLSRLRPLEEKFLKLPCQALCCALSGVRPVHPALPNTPGVPSSIWSEESIAWLRCKVSGVKLRAFPTRVEGSKLVIVDLFITPKNPKYKSPVSSSAGKGLPALQYSIAEMMIHMGMAQRIIPSVPGGESRRSSNSSPLSVGSNESLARSVSSVSIESSGQDGTCVNNCETVKAKDDSAGTDNSTSSKDTVVGKPLQVSEKEAGSSVKDNGQSLPERRSSKDDVCQEEGRGDKEVEDKSPGPNIEKEDCEKSTEQEADATMFQESFPVSGPEESFITELPPTDGPVCLQMLMSHVVSPSEFYVHLVTPNAGILDVLMDDLNKFYDSDPFPESCAPRNGYQPHVGEHCCARFSEDGRWYRGLVTSLRRTVDEKEGSQHGVLDVQVFHVDFGSSEWVSVGDVKPLVAKFSSLPGQVVKCRLANLKPEGFEALPRTHEQNTSPQTTTESSIAPTEEKEPLEEKPTPTFEPSTNTESSPTAKSRKKDRRKRKRPPKIDLKDAVIRAAGDESYDSSDLSEIEFIKSRKEDSEKDKPKEQDVAADMATFPEKYLLPSPDINPEKSFPLPSATPADQHKDQWASGSADLLSGLTDDNRKLVGYMVPWDPWVYQQLFYPTAGSAKVDITYKKPVLNLDLYDTTGDEDIFINQVLVDTGIAVFVENAEEETDTLTVKLSVEDLQNTASSMEQQGLPSEVPQDFHSLTSPTSPTSPLRSWDPMKDDFLSSKNTYAVNTDDLDIAFQGYQDLSRRVCRYFQTRSGCWRGDQCPNLHVKKGEELHERVEVFCDNMDSSVTLPDIGTWVAVRVTAVFNPGHFWVQFPYGTEPIEKRIMAARMRRGGDSDSDDEQGEDDLNSLMDKMGKFYSRNICQDSRRILPAAGELCVAKYSKDNKWYRARITSIREEELQVFFVDYGNSEWTRENQVKRIIPHFLHLPFQALECFLGNVEPTRDSQENGRKLEWSEDAMKTFKSLTEDKILIAHILSKAWNQTIYVDLWDTDGEDEIHINKVMIDKGFAQETDHTVSNPWNIEGSVDLNPHKMVGLPG